jgi:hypothetical protein
LKEPRENTLFLLNIRGYNLGENEAINDQIGKAWKF